MLKELSASKSNKSQYWNIVSKYIELGDIKANDAFGNSVRSSTNSASGVPKLTLKKESGSFVKMTNLTLVDLKLFPFWFASHVYNPSSRFVFKFSIERMTFKIP